MQDPQDPADDSTPTGAEHFLKVLQVLADRPDGSVSGLELIQALIGERPEASSHLQRQPVLVLARGELAAISADPPPRDPE